jgi:hypothetical protein
MRSGRRSHEVAPHGVQRHAQTFIDAMEGTDMVALLFADAGIAVWLAVGRRIAVTDESPLAGHLARST